jgi:uncharacterized membrane protein
LIALACAVLTVHQVGRRVRETIRDRSVRQVEDIADVASQAVFFGGIALVLLGNVAQHICDNTPPATPWLSLAACTSIVLAFGFHLGRLVMRWQMRHMLGAPRNGETAPT